MTDLVEMKVGSGRNSDGSKIPGYAARCGKSLSELLKENDSVVIKAMGGDAVNSAVKAYMHANQLLKEFDKHAIIKDVKLQHETLQRRDGVEVDAVLVAMTVTFDK
ncbi:hypothetical protein DXA62_14530 [Coprobacillus sp. OF03-2AA]|uniref:stage V sporulation protein S n=1 Tax=Faecalibacillus intestinalis TaxID=1982626 RepID=UPI000E4FF80A|nr:stage V sporulation protein S [Faecalibacillus intestinalis]RHP68026.1 hypothetical protein DXA62_14530 [Coprobacillus sp. OF03-2AA]